MPKAWIPTRRKRIALSAAMIVLFLAFFGFLLAHTASQTSGPHLQLPECPLHLGRGKPGELLTGDFPLANVGSEPLQFKIATSCGCSELKPRGGSIAPGEVQVVRVEVKLDGKAGSSKAFALLIETNDPNNPVVPYRVSAECPAPLMVSPGSVNFDRVYERHLDTARSLLTIHDAEDRPILDQGKITFRWSSKYLLVEQDLSNPKECRLRVAALPGLPLGDTYDTIELGLAGSDQVVKVPVRICVVGEVSVAPSTVFLSVDSRTGDYDERDVILSSANTRRPLGHLLSVQAPPGIGVTDTGDSSTTRMRLRLSGHDEPSWGPEGQVLVRCEGIEEPIAIRVVKPVTQ